jgi:hypothetical protein
MDMENCMLVDQAVPQSALGPGVTEFEVQVSDQTKSKSLPSQAANKGASDNAGIRVEPSRGGAVPRPVSPTPAPAPEASPRRTLERVASVTDKEAAENIATDTKDAFERGDLVASNKLVAKSVEFWAGAMYSHLQYLLRKFKGDPTDFVGQLDDYCSLYWKFICTRLLQVSDWEAAVKLGVILDKVMDKFPDLMSSLGVSVVKLLHGVGIDDVTFPDMTLSTRAEFFRSRLYGAFTDQVHLKKYNELLQASVAGAMPSSDDISELLDSCRCEVRKASLGFMRVYSCMLSDKLKAKYLIENESNFAHLELWLPSDRLHFLKIFVSDETVWRTVDKDVLVKGAYFLCSDS